VRLAWSSAMCRRRARVTLQPRAGGSRRTRVPWNRRWAPDCARSRPQVSALEERVGSPRLGEAAPECTRLGRDGVHGISGSELGARGRVWLRRANGGSCGDSHHTRRQRVGSGHVNGQVGQTGGGGIWGSMTLDARAASCLSGRHRGRTSTRRIAPGPTCSPTRSWLLDARTGALKCGTSHPRGLEDKDIAAAPVLYREARSGCPGLTRQGRVCRGIDRDTHEEIFHTAVTDYRSPAPRRDGLGCEDLPGLCRRGRVERARPRSSQ